MRYGISIPFGIFTGSASGAAAAFSSAFSGADAFLDFCGSRFDTAELRTVKADTPPRVVLNAVNSLKSRGLYVTVHASLCDAERFFTPYLDLFAAGLQDSYNLTVHTAKTSDDTERMLRDICESIEKNGYPVRITLENHRMKDGVDYGLCSDVEAMVSRISSPHLAICYDFGHQITNEARGIEPAPDDAFLSRVRHTHIHALGERTHFPLDSGRCELERNLTGLFSHGYDGVLSLELSPERYASTIDVRESLIHSIEMLKIAVHQLGVKKTVRDFYKNEYSSAIRELRTRFESQDDCFALLGHAAYAIKLGGVRIAVDCSAKTLPVGEEEKKYLLNWISDFDAVIVTHSHGDHFDREFIAALPESMRKIIPDFIDFDIPGRLTVTRDEVLSIGEIKLRFFNGAHFFQGKGVSEYGFCIEYDGKSYIFPVDARDYSHKYPHFENVAAVFTHLWLGRALATKPYEQYVEEFCAFAESFGAEKIYVAHLNEINRDIENMWSDIHVERIKERIHGIEVPKIGELIRLGC